MATNDTGFDASTVLWLLSTGEISMLISRCRFIERVIGVEEADARTPLSRSMLEEELSERTGSYRENPRLLGGCGIPFAEE